MAEGLGALVEKLAAIQPLQCDAAIGPLQRIIRAEKIVDAKIAEMKQSATLTDAEIYLRLMEIVNGE